MMKTAIKKHFWSLEALESFLISFLGFLAVDAAASFDRIITGGLTRDALVALVVAAGRSLLKFLWMTMKSWNKVVTQK